MYPFRTPSHAQLLNLAYEALGAAYDHNPVGVGAGTLRLFVALSDHVLAERAEFVHLSAIQARLLEHGQEHIVDLLRALADSAGKHTESCGCSRIASELVAELELQAADERRSLLAAVD